MQTPLRRLSVAAALLAASCVAVSWQSRADRAWEAGDLQGAAEGYETLLEGNPPRSQEARALYRLALIHLLPDSPRRDDRRAGELLKALLRHHPGSDYAPQAKAMLELQRQVSQLRGMSDQLSDHIEELRGQTYDAVKELQQEMGRVQGEAEAKDERIVQLQRQLARMRQQLELFNDQVTRLEEELRQLKEIDLAVTP